MNRIIRFFKRAKPESEKIAGTIEDEARIVLMKRKLEYVSVVGRGSFGTVLHMKRKDQKSKKVAAKVVASEKTQEGELMLWRYLKHPHVLPLLYIIRTCRFNLFVMPLADKNLTEYLQTPDFRSSTDSFDRSTKFLQNILSGLQYLHRKEICHLDLKVDNVLITYQQTAVICDFGFASRTTNKVNIFGINYLWRPPEACISIGDCPKVDGTFFDVWCYGMLALDVMIQIKIFRHFDKEMLMSIHCIYGPLAQENYWMSFSYPPLRKALKPEIFRKLVARAYPAVTLDDTAISQSLNLIQGILKFSTEARPDLSLVRSHPLIAEDLRESQLLEPDPIWCEVQTIHHSTLAKTPTNNKPEESEKLYNRCTNGGKKLPVGKPKPNKASSYQLLRTTSAPLTQWNQKFELKRAHSDTVLATPENRIHYCVYWNSVEGIYTKDPIKKKNLNARKKIRNWFHKRVQDLRTCFSCMCAPQNED